VSVVALRFIRPGKAIENAYAESLNGHFRDKCLNEHWFRSVAEAQAHIEAWCIDDHTVRPHASLGQQTPSAYAASCAGLPRGGRPARRRRGTRSRAIRNRSDSHYRRIGIGCAASAATEMTVGEIGLAPAGATTPAFDGRLSTPSRRLAVRTILGATLIEVVVPSTDTHLRIWTNGPAEPDEITIAVDRAAAGIAR
jgi:Integrase core domain